jgi:hypothetical protein
MVRITRPIVVASCQCKLKVRDDNPAAFDLAEFQAAMTAAVTENKT